jgi:molybdate transport system substrate-binding protein
MEHHVHPRWLLVDNRKHELAMRKFELIVAAAVISTTTMHADGSDAGELRVMMSGGLSAAYTRLAPEFERTSGIKILTSFGPSMGTTEDAIPVRLARGEPVEVLIMVGAALDHLIKEGKVVASSRVDLAQSPIGAAVPVGAPKPR